MRFSSVTSSQTINLASVFNSISVLLADVSPQFVEIINENQKRNEVEIDLTFCLNEYTSEKENELHPVSECRKIASRLKKQAAYLIFFQ